MELRDLIAAVPGARLAAEPPAAAEISEVVYRSGDAGPGSLFCCLPGARADGHDFAADALAHGAAALLVERRLGLAAPEVLVADARLAMGQAAAILAGHPSRRLAVVGITGTNGKTTTAYLIQAIMEVGERPCGLIGTVETRVGGAREPAGRTTPESPDLQALFSRMLAAGDLACAMEVSSHGLEQRRAAGTRFAAAVFTNLTRDHLDYHPDEESYYSAKRRLFRRPAGEGADPPAAVNLDDPWGRRLAGEIDCLGFSLGDGAAPVRAREISEQRRGIEAVFTTPRGDLAIRSPLRGRFNVENIASAIAVGELLGLDHEVVAAGIASLGGVPGRFEAVSGDLPFQVLVDYAHTPDSLENVLRAGRELAGDNRLAVVFGCGGDRDRGKRGPMGRAARELADLAVVTSDNPRSEDPEIIITEILIGAGLGRGELVVEPDRRAAIAQAVRWARPGDVVVIAGKGHESGQELADAIIPFDDRAVARAELAALAG